MALLLRRRGVSRVRPLTGGFHAWRAGGFPLVVAEATASGAGGGEQVGG